jgi:hypothetical protein
MRKVIGSDYVVEERDALSAEESCAAMWRNVARSCCAAPCPNAARSPAGRLRAYARRRARGMPAKNVYYNLIIALGLWGGVPMRHVLPFYKSYLSYIS